MKEGVSVCMSFKRSSHQPHLCVLLRGQETAGSSDGSSDPSDIFITRHSSSKDQGTFELTCDGTDRLGMSESSPPISNPEPCVGLRVRDGVIRLMPRNVLFPVLYS